MLIDTHCHLDYEDFDSDRTQVISRAVDSEVSIMVNPSTDLESSEAVVKLVAEHKELFAAVGVHPNFSDDWNSENRAKLKSFAPHKKVVAIGEIGLDYYWNKSPKDVQRKVFRDQLDLAAEFELPVIVHNRESSDDVMSLLLDWHESLPANSQLIDRPGVLHSFSGDGAMAEKAIAAKFFIGFTGPLTFKNAKSLQEIASEMPLENILVETDSPFLTPHPHRGQRNEPARVKLVAEKLAELKDLTLDEVAAATTRNAHRLFRFGERQ
ncbi:MAG TPA: TatD family hydrolase [Anaerolineales bacterium]|nr:TatD family hydrolase [Anaerolineales bacterium]